ncbi:MAG TPA: extracellular solute-binding protein [Clostridia bacterium]|nr:extracellular solute-binding protein [Clostridia bacterium]
MKKTIIKLTSIMLTLIFLLSIAGCTAEKPVATQTEPPKETKVEIKFFSNLPDRASGQGKLEQMLIDNYIKENPNVTIQLEALQDEPYKQKFKAYASGNSIPDIYMVWGQPSFFNPVMEAGYAAELNAADFKDYQFFNGALDGFSLDGKLYGLPRNTDYMVLYYNKALFESNGVKVPETFEEVIAAAKTFRAKGIAPIAMNGKDKWAISLLYQDLVIKEGGDQKLIYDAINGKVKFTENPILKKAAEDVKALMDVKGFQDSFVAADYGAANNLFAQEKAAMYYMGAWEVGMDSNPNFSDSFKKNVDVVKFPGPSTGSGKSTDILAWNGGGYAVSANSPVKDEAIKLLKYIMKPDNWAKNGWQLGLVVPGQKYDSYLTGKETNLQKKLTEVLSVTTSISGTSWNDSLTPDFKTSSENLSQELAAGMLTPEKFLEEMDKAAADASAK